MALPDGAHNFTEDTTFMLFDKGEYAVSHYRQIARADLKQVDEDVTRNTVQKAVVVICQNLQRVSKYRQKDLIFQIQINFVNFLTF